MSSVGLVGKKTSRGWMDAILVFCPHGIEYPEFVERALVRIGRRSIYVLHPQTGRKLMKAKEFLAVFPWSEENEKMLRGFCEAVKEWRERWNMVEQNIRKEEKEEMLRRIERRVEEWLKQNPKPMLDPSNLNNLKPIWLPERKRP
jgi:hypothetical protein